DRPAGPSEALDSGDPRRARAAGAAVHVRPLDRQRRRRDPVAGLCGRGGARADRLPAAGGLLPSLPGADARLSPPAHRPLSVARQRRLRVREGSGMTVSQAAEHPQAAHHPIGLIVDDDLKRNRLTVFFRILLAIPQLVVIALWGIAVYVVVIIAWF